ncbi:MAG: DUF5009 domain-containing protein [Saprospiraceae bacterium]
MNQRLVSLDVMRGIIMILLAGEAATLYEHLHETQFPKFIIDQFFHHEWHGLRFWDLVQPAFMTMAGTALYLSFHKNESKGITWSQNFPKVAWRCVKLLACGVGLHCVYKGKLVWELWNVLSQLSVTTLIAYLIIKKSFTFQFLVSLGLLLITFLAYNFITNAEFNEPYVIGKNLGSMTDMMLMGKINNGGWVAINCIPTAAHTIWGAMLGKWLVQDSKEDEKSKPDMLKVILIAGAVLLVVGYSFDYLLHIPIIKRICTVSFVIVSAGWVILFFALAYFLVEIKGWKEYAWIVTVIGMNSIFIYLFFETVGGQWVNKTVEIFTSGALHPLGLSGNIIGVINALVVLFLEWYLCWSLYKHKIFFKL